jgi:branched-chain amino acid transport system permease protein
VAFGISLGICAIAAIFFATTTQFNPLSGAPRLLNAFEAIVIGGVSSIWGALVGALLLGIAQSIGAYIDPTLQNFFGHVLFLIVLVFKPEGLFGRKS